MELPIIDRERFIKAYDRLKSCEAAVVRARDDIRAKRWLAERGQVGPSVFDKTEQAFLVQGLDPDYILRGSAALMELAGLHIGYASALQEHASALNDMAEIARDIIGKIKVGTTP